MMITPARLAALAPEANRDTTAAIAPPLDDQCPRYGVDTLLRRAHFLAQICYESDGFRRLRENLNYSAPRIGQVWPRLAQRAVELEHNPEALANAAYGGRLGNGDEASGDGARFSGRGLIQITGRTNYARFGSLAGLDLISNPDQAADPAISVRIALAYWVSAGCNEMADHDDCAAVTRAINGGENGLADRKVLTARAKEIFV